MPAQATKATKATRFHCFPTRKTAVAQLVAQLFAGGLLLGAVAPAFAANCTWSSATGNWGTASDWVCGLVPGAADTAGIAASQTVTINSGQAIQNLNNAGSVNIDAYLLSLQGGGSTVNTGTINVGAGPIPNNAALQVNGGHNITNTGGVINVSADSVVNQFGSSITGGIINTTGTGKVAVFSSSSNILSGLTLNGTLDMATNANSRERISNGLTLNGAANIANGGILSLDSTSVANQTIGGTGSINLNDPGARLALEGSGITTLGANIVVRGQGSMGQPNLVGGTNNLLNNGRISADVGGGTLTLAPPANSGSITNNNVLDARNGGTLVIASQVDNTNGQINALTGSTVVQSGVTITGGTLGSAGTGAIQATSSSGNFLSGVTLGSGSVLDLTTIANSRERISNGLTLNGAINIGNGGILSLDSGLVANQTIAGTGVIKLNDAGARLAIEGTGSTTLGSGITVRGQGNFGQSNNYGGNNVLTSNGLVSADVSGGTLNIVPPANSGSFINNGTLQAINGATLLLSTNITANSGSQIIAGAGSSVVQNGVTINGVINASGTGVFTAVSSASNYLDGVNFTGTLDLGSIANARERISNGATLNGAINIANGGILSLDSGATTGGNQTISGTAVINLNDAGARLAVDGTGSTTLGSGITVRGQGNFGQANNYGGNNVLTSNGLVSADVSGGTLNIVTPANGGSFINNGVMDARGGGTLLLSTSVANTIGQINAQTGSTVVQNGVTITGGTLGSTGTGVIQATGSGSNFLDGVTFNTGSVLDMTTIANSRERIINSNTINGSINVGNGGILSLDGSQSTIGNVVVIGSGVINLNDSGARLSVEGSGTSTLGANVTVRGQGNIGGANYAGGNNTLLNNGLILADGGTLTITAPANSGSFAGTGTLQVNGGALNVSTGSASTQGKLAIGATGTLGLGTQNLTLTSDYTNVQAGSGNSFDRRAGVTGTGQILAGGNAAQAITGTGVTNGNTANATLTINNVRVGATTYNYQVANTGTTGPSLRGAIQTSVNGANLTDARLSGSGVTASNYNTGAPGSNTGNLGVTFTAASAGVLAPLSGQVLNLSSNFSNIADQKLNIVLGAGAAAFNAAVGSTATPVTVANQRVGGSNSTVLVVSNTAAAGSYSEDLNATIAGNSGAATSSGSISGRTAGSSSTGTGAITVGVNTSVAGARSGAVTLNYQTAGAVGGVSNGLGVASIGSQAINVSGNVYQVAQPTALPATVNLGNFRAGTAQSQTISLTNTNISPAGFQEGLNATIAGATGAAIGTGALNNVAAGSSGSLQIGVTGVAGINTGTVQVQLATNGTGTSGLGNLDLGAAQTVNVSGTGYRLASANSQPATVNFGNVLQGSAQTQFLSIQNTAIADGFSERLDSSFLAGGTTGAATNNGGSVSLLAAGAAANNAAMAVGVNTGTIGAKSGQVIVAFDSNGSGTSGLGITGLPNQNIGVLANVSAVVGTLAQPGVVSPNPVNFGNFRVGDAGAGPASLSIRNNAAIGEGLNASIATGPGGFAANGAFTSLAPQATNNTSLQVSFNGTGTAGAKSGTATVTLVSDGTFNSGTPTALPSQTVALNANVFNVAQPTALPASVNVGSFRTTGSAITQAVSLGNTNISPAGFQEGLNANIVGASGNGVATGALNNVGAGASGSLQVGVAGVAGVNSGTVQVQLASNGTGTSGLGNLDLGAAKSVTVSGLGYTTAIGQVTTTVVDFGIVRVGDMVSTRNVTVQNTAAVTALNDSLRGTLNGVAGPFTTASNTAGGIAAGGATGNIAVGLNTSTAGVSNQSGIVTLLSQDPDLADVSAGADASVLVKAQINNLANAHFGLFSGLGALSQSGDVYTLDLGNIFLNSSNALTLRLDNFITGPADDLSRGMFDLTAANDFTFGGFGPLGTLAAGQFSGNLDVSYLASALGMFTDTIAFDGFSTNASDPAGIAEHRTLVINANVINAGNTVPEPGTLALMLVAAAGAVLARRRRTMAH